MKHETFLDIMRGVLDLPGASHDELKEEAIRRMEAAGFSILQDMQGQNFRVRVQRKEGRRYTYNVHTVSTSGSPVLPAFEKWLAHRPQEGGAA